MLFHIGVIWGEQSFIQKMKVTFEIARYYQDEELDDSTKQRQPGRDVTRSRGNVLNMFYSLQSCPTCIHNIFENLSISRKKLNLNFKCLLLHHNFQFGHMCIFFCNTSDILGLRVPQPQAKMCFLTHSRGGGKTDSLLVLSQYYQLSINKYYQLTIKY